MNDPRVVVPFNPLSEEDIVYDRKLQLSKEWEKEPLDFIDLLNADDLAKVEEKEDELILVALKDGDVGDAAYELRKTVDKFKEQYANDIAWDEVNEPR